LNTYKTVKSTKQSVRLKDLKTRKNPKGGYVDGNPSGASGLPIKDGVAHIKLPAGIPHG
jgi:hypothetical protein